MVATIGDLKLRVATPLIRSGVEVKRIRQVQGSIVKGEPVVGGPQVQGVALRRALGVQAAENVLPEVHGEASTPVSCRLVQQTPATQLVLTAQVVEVPQATEHLLDGDLPT